MRRTALVAILLVWAEAAAGQTRLDAGPVLRLVTPEESDQASARKPPLILPNEPTRPGMAPQSLPPLWMMPLPDAATRAAERAQLDAALEERFAHPEPPPQVFDHDIVPLAAGLPWQALQRRVNGTLGDDVVGPRLTGP